MAVTSGSALISPDMFKEYLAFNEPRWKFAQLTHFNSLNSLKRTSRRHHLWLFAPLRTIEFIFAQPTQHRLKRPTRVLSIYSGGCSSSCLVTAGGIMALFRTQRGRTLDTFRRRSAGVVCSSRGGPFVAPRAAICVPVSARVWRPMCPAGQGSNPTPPPPPPLWGPPIRWLGPKVAFLDTRVG